MKKPVLISFAVLFSFIVGVSGICDIFLCDVYCRHNARINGSCTETLGSVTSRCVCGPSTYCPDSTYCNIFCQINEYVNGTCVKASNQTTDNNNSNNRLLTDGGLGNSTVPSTSVNVGGSKGSGSKRRGSNNNLVPPTGLSFGKPSNNLPSTIGQNNAGPKILFNNNGYQCVCGPSLSEFFCDACAYSCENPKKKRLKGFCQSRKECRCEYT